MTDVRIVGGGPAGCACALALRAHAPSLSVELVDVSDYATPRVGETLPALARGVLEHLGVWNAFVAQGHRPCYGTVSAWGSPLPQANDFVFSAAGAGWHLDRATFDRMLFTAAGGVHSSSAEPARFTVDATGASASVARARGAQPIAVDRLVSFGRFFDDEDHDPRTIVESCEDGWWYTAGLPDGRRFAAFMTDADLARQRSLSDPEAWSHAAASLPLLGPLLRHANRASGPVTARSAESRRLDVVAGDDWLAAGDAASRFDPLSSQGILKALRSGTFAAYAIGDLLTRHDPTGINRYRAFIEQEFTSYLATRAKFYAEEQRWPESEFWKRRLVPRAHPSLASGTMRE
jgi:flavin-dependent dehydrogenase